MLTTDSEVDVASREVNEGFPYLKLVLLVPAHGIRIETRIDGEDGVGVGTSGYFPLETFAAPCAKSSVRARAMDQCSGLAYVRAMSN